jgi:hypothetical protein
MCVCASSLCPNLAVVKPIVKNRTSVKKFVWQWIKGSIVYRVYFEIFYMYIHHQ